MLLNRWSRLLTLAFLLALTTGVCWGDTWDAASSFEQGFVNQNNPNGVWSYGWSSNFTTPITLYDQTAQGIYNGPNAQFWLSSTHDIGGSPAAEYNNGPDFDNGNVDFLANEFLLVAGIGGEYSDLVFTAPANGSYSLASSFRGAQYGIGVVVGVVVNGNVVFNSTVTSVNQVVPFNTDLTLSAGDTVVLSVGPGNGTQNTGVAATFSSVPEPSSLMMLAPAGFAVLLKLRRSRA